MGSCARRTVKTPATFLLQIEARLLALAGGYTRLGYTEEHAQAINGQGSHRTRSCSRCRSVSSVCASMSRHHSDMLQRDHDMNDSIFDLNLRAERPLPCALDGLTAFPVRPATC